MICKIGDYNSMKNSEVSEYRDKGTGIFMLVASVTRLDAKCGQTAFRVSGTRLDTIGRSVGSTTVVTWVVPWLVSYVVPWVECYGKCHWYIHG